MGTIDMIDFFKSMFTSKLGRLFLASAAGILIFGGITWFLHKDEPIPLFEPMIGFYEALAEVEFCYTTDLGNDIFKGTAECPWPESVNQVEAEYMRRWGATPAELKHAGAVFVSETINCTTCKTCQVRALGCTNGVDIAVKVTRDWRTTLKVELGHVFSLHRYGDIDPDHKRPLYPGGTR